MRWAKRFSTDLVALSTVRNVVKRHYFQFLLVAPSFLIFIAATMSIIFGTRNPAFNFGMVFTWVVWWGLLIFLFVILGRGWCLMCPFGALGEWVQRLSLWWRRKWGLGYDLKYPPRLKNLWLAIAFFVVFIFLDIGYGVSNNPTLTAGLIIVLMLGAVWVNFYFERRAFCLYHCPLTAFIGLSSMFAPFEVRRRDVQVCKQCKTKACINGSEDAYGCPMLLRHCDFTINEKGYPACRATCPAGVDASGYISLVKQGKYREGVELHRQTTPLVATLGRVCTSPCERRCERASVDGAVSIRGLKRFMADHVVGLDGDRVAPLSRTRREKAAVIGSGPAGLSCAHDLVRLGYPVTVFEAAPQPGGLLRYGIPQYRLPKAVLDSEIGYIQDLGVEIRTATPVRSLRDIFAQGYRGVFLAAGAGTSQKLGIPGEDAGGVIHALDFLKRVNNGERVELGKHVGVIGGGNAAVDAARSALRLGAKEVSIVYRRSREEMPAIPSEVREAEREGVKSHFLAAPVRVLVDGGTVKGLECTRMELGAPDASGRRRPVPIAGSEFRMELDTVIVAIGQRVDAAMLPEGLESADGGALYVDPVTLQTNIEGVFAGGDMVAGPASVIEAIAHGKEAALSIHRYLNGQDLREGRAPRNGARGLAGNSHHGGREVMPLLAAGERHGFEEVEKGFERGTSAAEASRCWNCGLSPFPEGMGSNRNCILCTECIKACPNDNVTMRLRRWGQDLWGRTRGRMDEAIAATTIAALVTTVSLSLVLFLPGLKPVMDSLLPAGTPPNDWPRIVSIGILYLSGIVATWLLMFGFGHLSRLFSGERSTPARAFFVHFAYALIPLGVMKFLSDILDHVFRTWGAIPDVVKALLADFPFNRVDPQEVTVKQLMSADMTYLTQLVLVTLGFVFSLLAAWRLAERLSPRREVAFRAFLPIGTFIFLLDMAALWALSAAL